MKNTWKSIIGIAIILFVLFALPTLFSGLLRYGYGGMMSDYRGWSHPMMGEYNYLPFGGIFMGFGMLLAFGIPLALLGLVVYGAMWLANKAGGTPASERNCPKCGKPSQWDWNTCPYCGEPF